MVSFTRPKGKSYPPPTFMPWPFSTPLSLQKLTSSYVLTTVAPVRRAMGMQSEKWSPWPWVTRM